LTEQLLHRLCTYQSFSKTKVHLAIHIIINIIVFVTGCHSSFSWSCCQQS